MAVHLLDGLFSGMRANEAIVGQRERLLALGQLTAGLTHELNNPAAAAVRATSSLRERVSAMRHKLAGLASGKLDPEVLIGLTALQEEAVERVAKAPELSPLEASDREDDARRLARRPRRRRRLRPGAGDGGGRARPRLPRARRRPSRRSCTAAGRRAARRRAALDHLHGRDRAADERDRRTPSRGCRRWWARPSSTRSWTGPHTRTPTCTTASTPRWSCWPASSGPGIRVVKDYDRTLPTVPGLRRRAQPGMDEPHRQRARRHGRIDGEGTLTVRTDARRRLPAGRGRRHRPRRAGRPARPDLRALLHHQAGRRGHRAGARHLVPDRGPTPRRRPAGRVRPGRHPVPGAAADCTRPARPTETPPLEPERTSMDYVRLGTTGTKVSRICLGMMTYGDPTGASGSSATTTPSRSCARRSRAA